MSSPALPAERPIKSYAIVQSDGSLHVQGRTIWLFGAQIPRTGRDCVLRGRSVECISRETKRALAERIRGFVTCHPQDRYRDKSISAICYVDSGSFQSPPIDLGAWLIANGLAVASANAPIEYVRLERMARFYGRGLWEFYID